MSYYRRWSKLSFNLRMKQIEKILVLCAVFALFLKFLSIQGASFLTLVSFLCLACFYYGLSFAFFNGIDFKNVFKISAYRGLPALRILGAIVNGIGLATLCLGILYTALNFVGAFEYLLSGIGVSLIVLVLSTVRNYKRKDIFYQRIILRSSIMLFIGIICILL